LLFAFSSLFFIDCSNPTSAGSGSSAGNSKIACTVYLTDGAPAEGAEAFLRPKNYIPDTSNPTKTVKVALADSRGMFMFDSIDTGDYIIEVRGDNDTQAVIVDVSIDRDSSTMEYIDTLGPVGSVSGTISSFSYGAKAKVYIYGMEIEALTNIVGRFFIYGLPEGTYDFKVVPSERYFSNLNVKSVVVEPSKKNEIGMIRIPYVGCTDSSCRTDVHDDLLVAYPLEADEENQFDFDDGRISPYWDGWVNRDSIAMNTADHWYETSNQFEGENDARMVIKAAYSKKGLYLYCKIQDDTWIAPSDDMDFSSDAIDLFFDRKIKEDIKNTSRSEAPVPWNNALTRTSLQIQSWTTGSAMNDVNYGHWDNLLAVWRGIEALGGTNILTLAEAKENYGITIKKVSFTPSSHVQEWFLPWKALKINESLLENKLIAFSGGYNDMDNAAVNGCSKLRWLRFDPWSSGPYQDHPVYPGSELEVKVPPYNCSQNALDSWGHIYLKPKD